MRIISGKTGQEVFEFSQPITEAGPRDHDLARLSLNTRKTKLVIVGCEIEKHNFKQTFLLSDCEIWLTKINQFGDKFSI